MPPTSLIGARVSTPYLREGNPALELTRLALHSSRQAFSGRQFGVAKPLKLPVGGTH